MALSFAFSLFQTGCAGVYAVAPAPVPGYAVASWGGAGFYHGAYYGSAWGGNYYRNPYGGSAYWNYGSGRAYGARGGSASWNDGSGSATGMAGRHGLLGRRLWFLPRGARTLSGSWRR